MLLATVYGVFQLHAFGSATRTVGWRTWLLTIAAGVYGAGVVSLVLQWVSLRALDALVARSSRDVVRLAGYTVDPFIEEFVKLAPLVMIAGWAQTRWRWGLTDYVILGGASGAGFGFLEALMRFGATKTLLVENSDGWIVAAPSFEPPFVAHPDRILSSWVPAPASNVRLLEWGQTLDPSIHVVWSTLAGLGLGLLLRSTGWWRLLGLTLILFAGYDHAGHNARLDSNRDPVFETLGVVSDLLEPLTWAVPLVSIVVAVVLDGRVLACQRDLHPELLLAGETASPGSGLLALARFVFVRPPWTALVGIRFVLHRRSAMYSFGRPARDGDNTGHLKLFEEVKVNVERINNTSKPDAWRGLRLTRQLLIGSKPDHASTAGWVLRRWWPLLLWFALAAPAVVFYGSGPKTDGTVKTLAANEGFPVLIGFAVAATLWAAWRLVAVGRALVRGDADGDHNTMSGLILRCWVGTGTLILSGLVLRAVAAGEDPGERFWSNSFHIITALSALFLVAGLALVIGAVIFFPPVGVVAVAGGGTFLVPTLTAGFVGGVTVGTGLGVAGYALGQADQQATGRRLQTGAGRADGPNPTGTGGSPLPPGIPVGAAVTATIDAVGQIILTDAPGDQPVPRPEIDIDQQQYEDLNGDLRWKDSNQLVADVPTRSVYQDADGTWRYADTHQSADTEFDGPLVDETASSPVMGFETVAQFMDFGDALQSEFTAAGIDDAEFYMQGSAVTNQRFDDGTPFDAEKSDFDVLVVSEKLATRAREAGLDFRSSGRSQPVDDIGLAEAVGIGDAWVAVADRAGRDVSLMVVSSADVQGLEKLGVYIPNRTG